MKNIHLIPIDKSILNDSLNILKCINGFKLDKEYNIGDIFNELSSDFDSKYWQAQNIYITNDEIVTEYSIGLYFIDIYNKTRHIFSPIFVNKDTIAASKFHTYMNNGNMCKKIIMTTDPILILNGIQSIPDEFLEWFVKNPSCKSVEIKPLGKRSIYYGLKRIVIPKEKPKQEWSKSTGDIAVDYAIGQLKAIQKSMHLDAELAYKSLPKQETTLEEAAENNLKSLDIKYDCYSYVAGKEIKNAFIEGAKWQQERMYSEEEVLELLNGYNNHIQENFDPSKTILSTKEWFEQFKKK